METQKKIRKLSSDVSSFEQEVLDKMTQTDVELTVNFDQATDTAEDMTFSESTSKQLSHHAKPKARKPKAVFKNLTKKLLVVRLFFINEKSSYFISFDSCFFKFL